MRARMLIQDDSPRSWMRGHFIAHTLASAGKSISFQTQDALEVSTNYDVTVLVNWTPKVSLPSHKGVLIWDVPEHVDVNDPLVREYFHRVPVCAVADARQQARVRVLAHRVIILPTLLPNAGLEGPAHRTQGWLVLGPLSEEIREALHGQTLVTDQADLLEAFPGSALIRSSFLHFAAATRTVLGMIVPNGTDGGLVRAAIYNTCAPLIADEVEPQVSERLYWRARGAWRERIAEVLRDRPRFINAVRDQRQTVVREWSVTYQAQKIWWEGLRDECVRQARHPVW